jgi:hypothetical protein
MFEYRATLDPSVVEDISRRKLAAAQAGAMAGARKFRERAVTALRDDVRRAGLGDRLANTWRAEVYPRDGASLTPAVFVWSNAPEIIAGHSNDGMLRGRSGNWLAIPTENVPPARIGLHGRNVRGSMTPAEVEAHFKAQLYTVPARSGNLLAFIRIDGRAVPMFVLVRQVSLRPRLNWQRIGDDLASVYADDIGGGIAEALGRA